MELKIVRATVADARDLSYVRVLSWKAAYAGIVPQGYMDGMTPEGGVERAKQVMPTRPEEYYLAYCGGLSMGMFILGATDQEDACPNTGEVFALYLLPDYWGRGYGKALMDYAVNRLRELSYQSVVLWVLEENKRARAFYENYGYRFDGTRKDIEIGKTLVEIRYSYIIQADES